MTLLNPRVWLAALLIAVACFGLGYTKGNTRGKAAIQAKWDADIRERQAAQQAEKNRLEEQYANQIRQAIAERNAQIERVQADADNARAAAGSLRRQLAANRSRLATAAPAAVADYADTAADLLGECTARYTDMARAADGHAADAAALMQAWPRQ